MKAIGNVAGIASPMALILLGAQCTWTRVRGNLKHALIASSTRLILIPAVMLGIAILVGFRGVYLGVLMILFCAPTAVSSYVMAKNMHSDADLAGQIIVVSTIMSALTLFGWTFVLRLAGLI
jgi:predicted permease